MNRLYSSLDLDVERPQPATQVSTGTFSRGGSQPCTLFAPLHYEANYAYPLIVWLHGPDDNESQLNQVLPLVSLRNYVGVGLRGTVRRPSTDGVQRYSWSQSLADIALAEQRLFDAIEVARGRFNIAADRVFLAGYDAGGTMALRLALSHPQPFAGALSACGALPKGSTPLARLNDMRRLPVFLACGRDSSDYRTTEVCDNLRLLYSAGMSVSLRQYPCEQSLTTLMLSDMNRWIMEQVIGPAVTAE